MKNAFRLSATAAIVAAFAVPGTVTLARAQSADPSMAKVNIGAGLEGIADWSFSNTFADLVKQARRFGSPAQPWDESAKTDANGWPTGDFGVVLASWSGQKAVGGVYKIRFKCNTLPKVRLVASPGVISNLKRDGDGVVTADLTYPTTGNQLMLAFEGTGGGVRDLKVMRPGTKMDDVFTSPFLDHLKRFSTLRFMDWQGINNSREAKWSDRSVVSSPSYAAAGSVPWELTIDLCNKLKKDAWISIPHKADDAYVANLAKLLRQRMDPNLKVYVEYSNALWDWVFDQANWNRDQAKLDVRMGDRDLNFDKVNDENQWTARRIAKRTKTISDIFRKEYGDLAINTTIRPVMGSNYNWPSYWLQSGMTFLNARYGSPSQYLYGVAVSPYFVLGEADNRNNLTTNDAVAALAAGADQYKSDINLEACATMARFYGVNLLAYAAGPNTFGNRNIAAKRSASLDPRMQAISKRYLENILGYGIDLVSWNSAGASNHDTRFGIWGITNDMTNQRSPKILAVDQVNSLGYVPINQGTVVPAEIDGRQYMLRDPNWMKIKNYSFVRSDWRGPIRDYLIRSPKAQTYRMILNAATDQTGVAIEVWVDNVRVTWVNPKNTGKPDKYVDSTPIQLKLTPGLHTLRLRLAAGWLNLKSVTIK